MPRCRVLACCNLQVMPTRLPVSVAVHSESSDGLIVGPNNRSGNNVKCDRVVRALPMGLPNPLAIQCSTLGRRFIRNQHHNGPDRLAASNVTLLAKVPRGLQQPQSRLRSIHINWDARRHPPGTLNLFLSTPSCPFPHSCCTSIAIVTWLG